MAENQQSKFHPELWHEENLRLTEDQIQNLPKLQEILRNCSLPIAEILRESQPRAWSRKEMRELEHALLKESGKGKELKLMFDTLGKVVVQHHALTGVASTFPRSIHPVRLEKNPFHGDLVRAERLVDGLQKFLLEAAKKIAKDDGYEKAIPTDGQTSVALAVLSSIVHFHLLHESMVVALIEALADREKFLLHPRKHVYVYILSLAWQGEADAERRIFLPDILTGTFLVRIPETQVREVFAKGLDSEHPLKVRHKAILTQLENVIRNLLSHEEFDAEVSFKSILEAARAVAYLRIPPAIAALRCRKTVSHAPRSQVLMRLFSGHTVGEAPTAIPGSALSEVEAGELEQEILDISQVEPAWMQQMRDAFRAPDRRKTLAALTNIRQSSDPAGSRIADFGLSLLAGKESALSTAKRYSLLIARRLGCRLGDTDPATLEITALEDLYRDALDDDWENSAVEAEEEVIRRNKRATVESILRFHRYLQSSCNVAAFEELAPILKRRGLLPVDANFITIDEYLRVLAYISGPYGIYDPYLRSVLRLIIVLAFRCGLRRCEVFYLRVEDLDAADYLYVRTYDLRKVKTSNSNRAIPAGLLLSAPEMSEFRAFLLQRTKASRSGNRVLLFSQRDDASAPLNEERVFHLIHKILRTALQDRSLRTHHLRHSFATLLTAKLFPNLTRFAADFLPHHPETLRWLEDGESFRERLFGTLDVRRLDLQAIAHLLGHGSPATSVEHYIHSLDWFQEGR